MSSPIRVMHIISGLEIGGAEWSLHQLLSATDRYEFDPVVVSLTTCGPLAARIEELGVDVRALGLSRLVPNPLGVLSLASEIRRFRPVVVQTWMYHADLLGGVAARLAGGVPVAWRTCHMDLDLGSTRARTLRVARLCAHLSSRLPQRIVSCSHANLRAHVDFGYNESKMVIIPNGFDLELFRPDPDARRSVREELGLPSDTLLIGNAARYFPQKDHATLVRAAGILVRRHPEVHFVLCGSGLDLESRDLVELIDGCGVTEQMHLLGARHDVPRIFASVDIATMSSYAEAFGRVIAEAMATGAPNVVTDVGDAAVIVGDTGRVVPPRDPEALARAWEELLALGVEGRRKLGEAARRRIQENYDIRAIAGRYGELHRELARR